MAWNSFSYGLFYQLSIYLIITQVLKVHLNSFPRYYVGVFKGLLIFADQLIYL